MSRKIPVYKKHGDTRRIIFQLASKESPLGIDISSWSSFELAIDPEEFPLTSDNNIEVISGTIVDAATGRVAFIPSGTIPVGDYFYNARGLDHNGERTTFAHGTFKITQDI